MKWSLKIIKFRVIRMINKSLGLSDLVLYFNAMDIYSNYPLSRHPRYPPDFSFVRNKLLLVVYKVYAVRNHHPPARFIVTMYLKL